MSAGLQSTAAAGAGLLAIGALRSLAKLADASAARTRRQRTFLFVMSAISGACNGKKVRDLQLTVPKVLVVLWRGVSCCMVCREGSGYCFYAAGAAQKPARPATPWPGGFDICARALGSIFGRQCRLEFLVQATRLAPCLFYAAAVEAELPRLGWLAVHVDPSQVLLLVVGLWRVRSKPILIIKISMHPCSSGKECMALGQRYGPTPKSASSSAAASCGGGRCEGCKHCRQSAGVHARNRARQRAVLSRAARQRCATWRGRGGWRRGSSGGWSLPTRPWHNAPGWLHAFL